VSEPLVSALMASHNAAEWVGESIDSVARQSYPNLELIVVDDCSAQPTVDALRRSAARHPELVRLVLKTNREGPCRARNDALRLARGSLLCWLDHDDLWLPSKVEEQVRLLRHRPEVGLVYTYFDAFDSESGRILHWPDGRRDDEGDILAALFREGCFIGSVTTMFRRAALDRRGVTLRERDFSFGDDYYLWLTIALDWQVARIPSPLALYRRHGANESTRLATEFNTNLWLVDIQREFLQEFPEAAERLGSELRASQFWHTLNAAHLEAGRRRRLRAARLALLALVRDPRTALTTRMGTRPAALSASARAGRRRRPRG
jgi:glycosyltransferase involved in cell wall biosynthesis